MRYRAFGATGLSVSEIGVGCSRIGGVFSSGSTPADELRMLQEALDAGINFFDTADLYSHGQSEILVGKAIKRRRSEVVVATKGGYVLPAQSRLVGRIKPILRPIIRATGLKRPSGSSAPMGAAAQDFSPDYLAAAVDGSLRRLGTDYIDIYQLHSPPRTVVEAGDFIAGLEALKEQGKIRHFGVAADLPGDVDGFDAYPSITSLEVPFSIIHQDAALDLLPKAAARGVGVISRSCFASGLLVGTLTEAELRERTPEDWEAVLAFRATAAELGRPRKELALQFNLGVEEIAVTLLGLQKPAQLAELLRLQATPALTGPERAALV